MKLFIADDEIDVREGLRYILDWSELGFYICGEGKNGADTLEQILISRPDVVLWIFVCQSSPDWKSLNRQKNRVSRESSSFSAATQISPMRRKQSNTELPVILQNQSMKMNSKKLS